MTVWLFNCPILWQQPDDDGIIQDMNCSSMSHMTDGHHMDLLDTEQIPDSQNDHIEHEISQNFEGAPELVRDLSICIHLSLDSIHLIISFRLN